MQRGSVTLRKIQTSTQATLTLNSPVAASVTVLDGDQRWTVSLIPGQPVVLAYAVTPSAAFTDPDLIPGDLP